MRSNRRKNWFIKRIALGFAIAASRPPSRRRRSTKARPSRRTATSRSSRTSRRPRRSARPVTRSSSSESSSRARPEQGRTCRRKSDRARPGTDAGDRQRRRRRRLRHASRDAARLRALQRRSDRGRPLDPERNVKRQDRVRSLAAALHRRAATRQPASVSRTPPATSSPRGTSTGRTLGSAQASLSRSSSSAPERRSSAATPVARRPLKQHAKRAAHIVSGPNGPLTAAWATPGAPCARGFPLLASTASARAAERRRRGGACAVSGGRCRAPLA